MMLCQPDLNEFRRFFRDAQEDFVTREGIVAPDPRQPCLLDFVYFCLDRLKAEGAVDSVPESPDAPT